MNILATSLRQGLLKPLGFSSLKDVLFPEDKILLVPDDSCIARPEILKELINVFLENGIQPQDISVLLTEIARQTCGKSTADALPGGIEVKVFNPSMNGSLALLGIDESGQPLALCRHLVDADMVITVSEWKPKSGSSCSDGNYYGIHSAVFPQFSSIETQQRFVSVKGAERKKLQKETENAALMLGIVFTVQFTVENRRDAKRKTKENLEEKLHFTAGLPDAVCATLTNSNKQRK